MGTRVFITGGSGLLGSNLICEMAGSGFEVVATYLSHPIRGSGFESFRADITNEETYVERLREFQPDYVVNCAAMANVDVCEKQPALAFDVNERAVRMLAERTAELDAKLIHISTDAVFDGLKGNYSEDDDPNPVNVYAESKLAGERAALDISSENVVLRTNIYGWNMQNKTSLAEWILWRLENGQEVPGFTDVIVCPMLVNHLAKTIVGAMEADIEGLYHAAGSEACSKYDFARIIAATFDLDDSLVKRAVAEDAELAARRPKKISMDTRKISLALGREMPGVLTGLEGFRKLRESGYAEKLKSLGKTGGSNGD